MRTAKHELMTSTFSNKASVMRDTTTETSIILQYADREIVEYVISFVLSGPTCFFGIVTNVINIMIFLRQGLDSTINISFFALAISDFFSLVTLQWLNISVNPFFVNSGINIYTPDILYLTAAWPHVCFGHITCWITAYMTAERCLCITLPLKVKQIVTPRRTTLILIFLYILNLGSALPEYASIYYDWKFYPDRNRTLLGLKFKENRKQIQGMSFILLAVIGIGSFPLVMLFTGILVVKLRQQTKWRMKSAKDTSRTESTTKRDVKTMNMVVLIAGILLICYSPGIMASLASFFVPGFNVEGSEINLFYAIWEFVFWLEAINSSVNIFLYYKMSTKYRNSFNELFLRCRKSKVGNLTNEDEET